MQQIIIYFNIQPYRILFFSKIRALQMILQIFARAGGPIAASTYKARCGPV
jgi:hypothetical protein